jgi:hypothetical protein
VGFTMSRVTDIILNARDTLGDPLATRWSDDLLIRKLNLGLRDFAFETRINKVFTYVELDPLLTTYNIDNVISFDLVEYKGKELKLNSYRDMAKEFGVNWQDDTSNIPTHIVADVNKLNEFRLYPRLSGITNNLEATSPYGFITDITYNCDVITHPALEDLVEGFTYLKVYYSTHFKPVTLSTIDAEFDFPEEYDSTLIHYVAGSALRDDHDTQHRTFGAEELQLYSLVRSEAGARDVRHHFEAYTEIPYNNGFN